VGHGFWQFPCSSKEIEVISEVAADVILNPYIPADGSPVKDLIVRETKRLQTDFEVMEQENYLSRYRSDSDESSDDSGEREDGSGSENEGGQVKGFEALMQELRAQDQILSSKEKKTQVRKKRQSSQSTSKKPRNRRKNDGDNDGGDDNDGKSSSEAAASVYSSDSDSDSNGSGEDPLFDERGEYVNYETFRADNSQSLVTADEQIKPKPSKPLKEDNVIGNSSEQSTVNVNVNVKGNDESLATEQERSVFLEILRKNRKLKNAKTEQISNNENDNPNAFDNDDDQSKPNELAKKRSVKMILSDDEDD
jgi:tellurite resistance protein